MMYVREKCLGLWPQRRKAKAKASSDVLVVGHVPLERTIKNAHDEENQSSCFRETGCVYCLKFVLLSAFSLSLPVTVTVDETVASRSCDSAFVPRTKTRGGVMLARVEQRLLRRELIQFGMIGLT
jgi:hypothetical protein